MSLIRTGLVLGAVIYMMPTDSKRQADMIHAASDTLVWGVTYCDREPAVCDQAKAAWGQMVEKAKFGAALASDLAQKWSEQRGERQAAAPAHAQPASINALIGAEAPLVPDDTQPDALALDPAQQWNPSING
jgi:hypothetical protein